MEPVPIAATRLPSKRTESSHRAVCTTAPWKLSSPGISGMLGWCSTPVAAIRKSHSSASPAAVVTRQPLPVNSAAVTSCPHRICGITSRSSATWR
ncbi:Uncharacterised protein [Mycobacteroides abscessus subsp. abscessus]|nr:Uncharacterised protein [Mycobacteroides abscessus subsp. abscessus]